jgi:hypothetical protein
MALPQSYESVPNLAVRQRLQFSLILLAETRFNLGKNPE